MTKFRDELAEKLGLEMIVHTNPEGRRDGVGPFTHGSAVHTDIMKTQALKQALDKYRFDVAFGGARRDEEKSRAKERVFSFRTATHHIANMKFRHFVVGQINHLITISG